MDLTSSLEGLAGITLILVICALLFVEEAGVPIPFAPGDLLLAVAGIALATGRVNPLVVVGLTFLSIVVGAMLGRELFSLLGWERLMKVASRIHAGKPLERAAEMLHRSGWRAVFMARLIPGLRVHTTQVAGVSRMRRTSFLAGLLPAAALYEAAFVGLGAAFGRPILGLIHRGEHQLLLLIAGLAVGVVLVLWGRSQVRRTLASLEMGGWAGPFTLRLDSPGAILIPACLGINFAGHALGVGLHLPLFLDSVGTILAGVLGGPWLGGCLGFVSNLLTSNTVDPVAGSYAIVSFALGFTAGLARHLDWQRRRSGWVILAAVCVAISSIVSTPINLLVAKGNSGVWLGDNLFHSLMGAQVPMPLAAYAGEFAVDLPDKLLAVGIALLIARGLSRERPPSQAETIELDLSSPFTFVFRSQRWIRRLMMSALCLAFSWLVVPGLILLGYVVAIARHVRAGEAGLPAWDRPLTKLGDGFKIAVLFLLWNLPGILASIPSGITSDAEVDLLAPALAAAIHGVSSVLSVLGNLWQFLVLLIQAAIWSQYLAGGFRAALDVGGVLRRLRYNLGLSVVIGAFAVVLSTIGVIGVVLLIVGVLFTLVYVSWVWAHLVGTYARMTDVALRPAPALAPLGTPAG